MDYIRTPFLQARIEHRNAARRLKLAALATLVIAGMYIWMGIQIASDAGMFIPQ